MPIQDTSELKEKIISFLKRRGPSLPVHIAKEVELSILFTSAFLSELMNEKKLKMSKMKVGNSSLYLLHGQEPMLEKFSTYLKSKEKDAFIILKSKKIIEDKKQDPAIRVALRAINDFAIPFKKNEEIFWKYFTINNLELENFLKPITQKKEVETIKIEKKNEELNIANSNEPSKEKIIENKPLQKKSPELNIFENKEISKEIIESKPIKKKAVLKKTSQKKNEKFFDKVKNFLSKESIEILDIVGFNKTDLILKVKNKGEEQLLIAYNKKRITEIDLIKAYKRTLEIGIPYIILSLGETPKKLKELLDATKNLKKIGKLE